MAIKVQYLDVGATQFPVDKFFTFGVGSFLIRFRKNARGEVPFYTGEVFSANGKTFLFSSQFVYAQEFIDSLLAPFQDQIIPLNVDRESSGLGADYLTDETLGNEVLLATDIVET
jgi:hypothetical protein